jgi:CheY-like chemotaxis protein
MSNSEDRGVLEIVITDQINKIRADENQSNDDSALWLTICKNLAESLGGSLEANKSLTRYRLKIPLLVISKQNYELPAVPHLNGKHILAVTRLPLSPSVKQHMEDWGLEITCVEKYTEATNLLNNQDDNSRYDLALLNLQNIDEDSLAFAQRLLSQGATQDLPQLLFIKHTHINLNSVQDLCQVNKNVNYLFRPISLQKLQDELVVQLTGKKAAKRSPEVESRSPNTYQILLVEDHRVNQMVTEKMLKKLGFQVSIASNGLEALTAVESGDIDLVLMDCQMPEMDGFEATRRIREMEQQRAGSDHIPIIAMTAHTHDNDQSLCFASGMDDYLAKPINFELLDSYVTHWLHKANN